MTKKEHFKLYKAGKLWLVAGIMTFGLAVAGIQANTVSADETTPVAAEVTDNGEQTNAASAAAQTNNEGTQGTSASAEEQSDPTTTAGDTSDGDVIRAGSGADTKPSETPAQESAAATDTENTTSEDEVTTPSETEPAQQVASAVLTKTNGTTTTASTTVTTDVTVSATNASGEATSSSVLNNATTAIDPDATDIKANLSFTNTTTSAQAINIVYTFPAFYKNYTSGQYGLAVASDTTAADFITNLPAGLKIGYSFTAGAYNPLPADTTTIDWTKLMAIQISGSLAAGASYTASIPLVVTDTPQQIKSMGVISYAAGARTTQGTLTLEQPIATDESGVYQAVVDDKSDASDLQAVMPAINADDIEFTDANGQPVSALFKAGSVKVNVTDSGIAAAAAKLGYAVATTSGDWTTVTIPAGTAAGTTDQTIGAQTLAVSNQYALVFHRVLITADSTLGADKSWSPADNFDADNSRDVDGTAVTFADLTVTLSDPAGILTEKADGTYSFNNSGSFQVTYSDENAAGVTYTRTVTVTVVPVESVAVGPSLSVDPADYYDYTQAGVVPDTDPEVREEVGPATSVDPADYYDYTEAGVVPDTDPEVREEVGPATSVDPADYYDYTQAGVVPDTDPEVREEVGPATSVDPADYYDYTQAGVVPDTDPEVREEVGPATSVDAADYYDYTQAGVVPDTDPAFREEVGPATSVDAADYYDYTQAGVLPDTDPEVREEVGPATSVDAADYYDYTQAGVEPDTDPQVREEVGAATSVDASDYYDHTSATTEPASDEDQQAQQPVLPQTGSASEQHAAANRLGVNMASVANAPTTPATTAVAGKQLPQTGDRQQNPLVIVGLALLVLVGSVGVGRARKQRA